MAASSGTMTAFVALLVLWAGCTSASSETQLAAPEDDVIPVGPLVSDTEGGVVGVVLDEGLAPIVNATVSVSDTSKDSDVLVSVATDAAGAFTVGPFAPQTYRLTIEAPGFAVASQLVQVAAGELSRVTITMGAVASKQPYIELLIETGVTGCSMTMVWLVLGGPCPVAFPDTYKSQFQQHISDDWAYAVVETAWQSADAIWMFVDLDNDGTCLNPGAPCPGSVMGTSPIRVDAAPESGLGTDRFQHGDIAYPPAGEGFDVWINFNDFGLLYNEINNYGKPICDLNGYCGGVGTSVEIRFDAFTSIFHHEPPPTPEQYSALPDA